MKKKYALFLAVLITLIIWGNYLFFDINEKEGVVIKRAIDGDTIELEDGRIIRLENVNTPERNERGYEEAKDFLAGFVNESVYIDIGGREKYGRILGKVYYDDNYLNLEIIERGLGHTILVNEEEIDKFKKAQEKAFKSEKGIWTRSKYYGCLSAEINKNKEFVIITRKCNATAISWTIKDESTHPYILQGELSEETTLYSSSGTETEKERYWKRGKVWNDDRDSIFIRDNEGFLVYYDSYGY